MRGMKVSKRGVGYLYIFFSWAYSYLRSLKRATLLYRYDARRWTSAPVGYYIGTPYARPPHARNKWGPYPLARTPTTQLISILSFLICRSFIQPIHLIFSAQVEIKFVHVSTTTVLGECEVTISITIEFQVTHCCGHVLDSV